MNHAFENGNKRTALVSTLVCLDKNMLDLAGTDEDDLYEMATSVVAKKFGRKKSEISDPDEVVRELGSWLRSRTRKQVITGDRSTEWSDLRVMLIAQGCTLLPPQKNFIRIARGSRSVKTGYPRARFTVDVGEVKRIRRRLGLDFLWSSEFYEIEHSVDRFVSEHQSVLWRLADA
jgi:death-on-curing protein